jgi:hypothetical protein
VKPLVTWYKSVKAEAECVTCQRWEHSVQPDQVEFHHIVPDTKTDCVSNYIYRHQIIHRQPPQPVAVMLEFMKCVLMCHTDHTQLHDAERAGKKQLLADRFDLVHDDGYQKLNGQFWQLVIGKSPVEIRSQINEGLLDLLEEGQIILGPRGFQLASTPPPAMRV